jgi:hypothetical protein
MGGGDGGGWSPALLAKLVIHFRVLRGGPFVRRFSAVA